MHQVTINIPDDAYATASKRAQEEGFGSTEVFLSEVLLSNITVARALDPDNYDHLFTPEVVADLRGIAAEMEAGGPAYSMEEVREHFVQKRKAWLANHPS